MSRRVVFDGPSPPLPTHANVWDGTKMTYPLAPPEPYPDHPGWVRVCCGCCAGTEWGGEAPRECRDCGGSGSFAVHLASGRGALWPGGPFNGARFASPGV